MNLKIHMTEIPAPGVWLLSPLLLAQGLWVRRRTPRLPGAAGPDTGEITGAADTAGPPLRLLVIGESTVAGVGARRHEEALTGQLARELHTRLRRPVRWRACGKNGVTAARTRTELVPQLPVETTDILVIALGVNDTLSRHGPARWTADLRALSNALREKTSPALLVLSGVPPMQAFPALPQPLRAFLGMRAAGLDQALRELVAEIPGAIHAPFTFTGDDTFFCEDRFHPSVKGYQRWGEHLADQIALSLPPVGKNRASAP
ncbi:MAG: SGNH/GDSL hydrolase family protein [Blastocatellia bacterium]